MITAPQKTNIIQLGITLRTVCTYVRYMSWKNLTFSEDFRSCSARTPADSCAERRGSSAGRPRSFRAGGYKFQWNVRNQKTNFVCNNSARIEKDIVRIVRIIIVGLDNLSPSSAPVELGEIREGIILAISVNTKRRNKSVRLRITSAEFRTKSTNCSAQNPLIVPHRIR